MISSTGESKSKLIGRRMFIISAAKAVVVLGILGRLCHFKLMKVKNTKLYLIKIDLESGNFHHLEEQ